MASGASGLDAKMAHPAVPPDPAADAGGVEMSENLTEGKSKKEIHKEEEEEESRDRVTELPGKRPKIELESSSGDENVGSVEEEKPETAKNESGWALPRWRAPRLLVCVCARVKLWFGKSSRNGHWYVICSQNSSP